MTTLTASSFDNSAAGSKLSNFVKAIAKAFADLASDRAIAARDFSERHRHAFLVYRLADSFESSQPNLATELRFIASRG